LFEERLDHGIGRNGKGLILEEGLQGTGGEGEGEVALGKESPKTTVEGSI